MRFQRAATGPNEVFRADGGVFPDCEPVRVAGDGAGGSRLVNISGGGRMKDTWVLG